MTTRQYLITVSANSDKTEKGSKAFSNVKVESIDDKKELQIAQIAKPTEKDAVALALVNAAATIAKDAAKYADEK